MCENLSFKTMCEVPFGGLVACMMVFGEECVHDSMYVDGIFLSESVCQEAEVFGECAYYVVACMLDFPCAENEVAKDIEYRAQVNLNHLLHEADDFWID